MSPHEKQFFLGTAYVTVLKKNICSQPKNYSGPVLVV